MGQPSINELMERLAWSKERVNQLEAKCESWRNQALLAQAREKAWRPKTSSCAKNWSRVSLCTILTSLSPAGKNDHMKRRSRAHPAHPLRLPAQMLQDRGCRVAPGSGAVRVPDLSMPYQSLQPGDHHCPDLKQYGPMSL
jgi:hypothetical protein